MSSKLMALTVCVGLLVFGNAFARSKSVPLEKLAEKAAFSLGLQAGDVAISSIEKEGTETNFMVATKAGKKYRCYVTSTSGLTALMSGGANVSDALCSKPGEPARNPLLEAASQNKR